jgi:hypothetical protein
MEPLGKLPGWGSLEDPTAGWNSITSLQFAWLLHAKTRAPHIVEVGPLASEYYLAKAAAALLWRAPSKHSCPPFRRARRETDGRRERIYLLRDEAGLTEVFNFASKPLGCAGPERTPKNVPS